MRDLAEARMARSARHRGAAFGGTDRAGLSAQLPGDGEPDEQTEFAAEVARAVSGGATMRRW
jgi:hypothetical protein